MKIKGEEKRALWSDGSAVYFIDQRKLPYKIEIFTAKTVNDISYAIKDMVVRGAPAIGAAAVYGMAIGKKNVKETVNILRSTRPTAHDLFYAIHYMEDKIKNGIDAFEAAEEYIETIINHCKKIGEYGDTLITEGMSILTHCNAGALATVDYGTALAPFRIAHQKGKQFFVYADETRPRIQGILTSWELFQEGIPHAVIVDNAAGFYMKQGKIDMVLTGADRITKNGDFANKIGTYEKAVLAKENNIPFYVAAPSTTFDTNLEKGNDIIIEERDKSELRFIHGNEIMPEWVDVYNPAFDVTPHRYVTGYITEKGIKKVVS
ncbi:MAG: S-methyl-5-thioribose-1-phosphate isomerase [Thermoplasmatota archaeon]